MNVRLATKPTPEAKPPAQELTRHTPKAAANHLSLPERIKRDAAKVEDDVAALERVQQARPDLPFHRRPK